MRRNIKLTIEYDGTGYSGWQRQSRRPSIQAELERAIREVTKENVDLIGAGRTDAGVHALGQVANFGSDSRITVERLPGALNAHLPEAIRVQDAEEVDEAFHARYSATGRTYRYAILNRAAPSAILRFHAYHVPERLDLQTIEGAMADLRGTHQFTAFRGVGSGERTTTCTLRRADVARSADMVIFTFEADRFLRHMVRLIVGTLLRVGHGKLTPESVGQMLSLGDNQRTGPRAPAQGLFLVRVVYP